MKKKKDHQQQSETFCRFYPPSQNKNKPQIFQMGPETPLAAARVAVMSWLERTSPPGGSASAFTECSPECSPIFFPEHLQTLMLVDVGPSCHLLAVWFFSSPSHESIMVPVPGRVLLQVLHVCLSPGASSTLLGNTEQQLRPHVPTGATSLLLGVLVPVSARGTPAQLQMKMLDLT